jgi:hypothetical protein
VSLCSAAVRAELNDRNAVVLELMRAVVELPRQSYLLTNPLCRDLDMLDDFRKLVVATSDSKMDRKEIDDTARLLLDFLKVISWKLAAFAIMTPKRRLVDGGKILFGILYTLFVDYEEYAAIVREWMLEKIETWQADADAAKIAKKLAADVAKNAQTDVVKQDVLTVAPKKRSVVTALAVTAPTKATSAKATSAKAKATSANAKVTSAKATNAKVVIEVASDEEFDLQGSDDQHTIQSTTVQAIIEVSSDEESDSQGSDGEDD